MDPVALRAPGPVRYERHRPETTLLVERHYPEFLVALSERDHHLPLYVENEFGVFCLRQSPRRWAGCWPSSTGRWRTLL